MKIKKVNLKNLVKKILTENEDLSRKKNRIHSIILKKFRDDYPAIFYGSGIESYYTKIGLDKEFNRYIINNENFYKSDERKDFESDADSYQEMIEDLITQSISSLSDEHVDFASEVIEDLDDNSELVAFDLEELLYQITPRPEDILKVAEEGEEILEDQFKNIRSMYELVPFENYISKDWEIRALGGNDVLLMKGGSKIETSIGKKIKLGNESYIIQDLAVGMGGYMTSTGYPGFSMKLSDQQGNTYYYYNLKKGQGADLKRREDIEQDLLNNLERYYR